MEHYLALDYFFDVNKRVFYLYILSSIIISFIYLYFNSKERKINFSKKLWLHPSAKLDYIYFFISNIIKIILIYPIVLSANTVALSTTLFLVDNFGYTRVNLSYELIMILFTFSIFITSDFTRYLLHRLLHIVPFLWEFHKVHHSAKVLNPLTFYRVHPMENILFGLRYSLTIGFVTGIFIYFFGARISIYEILGANIFVFVFSILGSNLRHSHIRFTYPKYLEIFFISPFMHQIHHSKKHLNKNFGGTLAIWDYLFNTHQSSQGIGHLKFGIKQMNSYVTILNLLFVPFINLKNKISSRRDNEIFNTA